ncbi:MAG: hypothetical protein NPIRA02_31420 [Nitrospirales bacterium]|nr:MAG: hypothetical protein NPIRA02_31420 [Nitrospirales bacterium]
MTASVNEEFIEENVHLPEKYVDFVEMACGLSCSGRYADYVYFLGV